MINNLFRKIWSDSVGSKVIASFIFAGLMSILNSLIFMISKNPMIGIYLGSFILVLCSILIIVYNQLTGIKLNVKNNIISAACSDDKINHISNFIFYGMNKSKKPIIKISGYLQSNITNEKYPIYFNINGDCVLPEETNGIPPKGEIQIIVPLVRNTSGEVNLNYGLDIRKFEEKLNNSTLTLELDGILYKKQIPPKIIKKNMEQIRSLITPKVSPHITKKDAGR